MGKDKESRFPSLLHMNKHCRWGHFYEVSALIIRKRLSRWWGGLQGITTSVVLNQFISAQAQTGPFGHRKGLASRCRAATGFYTNRQCNRRRAHIIYANRQDRHFMFATDGLRTQANRNPSVRQEGLTRTAGGRAIRFQWRIRR